jgi:large repetitive protein
VVDAQTVVTPEDTARSITLTGSDPDGDPITFAIVQSPAHGVLTGTPPTLTYTPAPDYNGTRSASRRAMAL